MSRIALLAATMEEAYARLRARLEGLTDPEFFWQPVPDAWTIYEDRPGHWTYDYAIPDPDPAPVTTVGWQVVHIATTKVMYNEWAYGAARLTFPEIEIREMRIARWPCWRTAIACCNETSRASQNRSSISFARRIGARCGPPGGSSPQ